MSAIDDLKKPFRLTIEHYDQKVTIELDHSDISFDDLIEAFRSAALAAGFSPTTINEYLDEQ